MRFSFFIPDGSTIGVFGVNLKSAVAAAAFLEPQTFTPTHISLYVIAGVQTEVMCL